MSYLSFACTIHVVIEFWNQIQVQIIDEKATYVIANYAYSQLSDFIGDFTSSDKIKNLGYAIRKAKIDISSNMPVGIPLPVIAYDVENSVHLLFSLIDRRLDLLADDYSDKNKDVLNNLFLNLVKFKISDNIAIGINFVADCCTDKKRLCLLNTKINNSTIDDWDSNMGFKLFIPMKLDAYNCVANYSISKLQGGKATDQEFVDYIYKISVNYNFVINADKANIEERLKYFDNIVSSTADLHKNFRNKCDEISKLC